LDTIADNGWATVHRCDYAVGFPAHSACKRIGVVVVRVMETGEIFHACKQHAKILHRAGGYLIHPDGVGRRFAMDVITVGVTP
jgi:hypothetical protein